jgi:hypothetical protein
MIRPNRLVIYVLLLKCLIDEDYPEVVLASALFQERRQGGEIK